MAITRESVQQAVEKYLPRTVNFTQSADLGERDQDAIYKRIQQILLTSLLVDADAAYFIFGLAAKRLQADLRAAIADLDALTSVEQLKGISPAPPSRIDSYVRLVAASTSLVRLSNGVVSDGVFGESALLEFRGNVESFLSTEIAPNVSGGNRAQTSRDIRRTMESLQANWSQVVARRGTLFGVLDAYVSEDLRTRVSAIIISSIQVTLQDLLKSLPALSTTQQAESAEQVLIDLAAAEASIAIVGGAPSPVGTVVALGADASTLADYIAAEGVGRLEAVSTIRSGSDGALALRGPVGGAPFASVSGQTTPPGIGSYTSSLEDPAVADFVAQGITPGMYLTFVDAGTTHYLSAVSATALSFTPTTKHLAGTPQRYAVTAEAPGELFASPSGGFWAAPGSGAIGSTVVASGTLGSFPRQNKLAATDGTNLVATGTSAVFRPRKASGSTANQGPVGFPVAPATYFQDANATFLSDQVKAGDSLVIQDEANAGTYSILSVASEAELHASAVFAAETGSDTSWHVEDPLAASWVEDASASYLTAGVTTSHTIRFVSAPLNGAGDYTILNVLSQSRLEVSGGPHLFETGASWQVRKTANNELHSSSSDFFAEGVQVGDLVDIAGEGVFTITGVAQSTLTLSDALSTTALVGASFTVYAAPGTWTEVFKQADGVDFEALGVGPQTLAAEYRNGAPVSSRKPTLLTVAGVVYSVLARDASSPPDTLVLLPLAQGVGEFTSSTTFEDVSASFGGIPGGGLHELVVLGGANSGSSFAILSATSSQLTLSGAGSISADNTYVIRQRLAAGPLAWELRAGSTSRKLTDLSGANPFSANSEGWTVVWNPGPGEVRTRINTFVSASEVWLTDGLPEREELPYAYVDELAAGQALVAAGRTYHVTEVVDAATLRVEPKLANSAGAAIDYQILRSPDQGRFVSRIYDPSGAFAYSPSEGFGDSLKGLRVDLTVGTPVSTRFARPYDPGADGFAEAFQVETAFPLGARDVAYRILSAEENTSSQVFIAPAPASAADVLTLWRTEGTYNVDAVGTVGAATSLTVSPRASARTSSQYYAVVRGGGTSQGRYEILSTINADLLLDATTGSLRLNVAEVLLDFGAVAVPLASGSDGSVSSSVFESASGNFVLLGATVGDRLTVGGRSSFITRVLSETSVEIDPVIPGGISLTWELDRTSVSEALREASRLRQQLSELLEALEGYSVARNATLESIIDLLREQHLDRALDMLYDGQVADFLNLDRLESSYATYARAAIQTVGSGTLATAQTRSNLAGVNPAMTSVSTSASGTSTAGQAMLAGTPQAMRASEILAPSPAAAPPISATGARSKSSISSSTSDVDVRLALAKAVNDIADDELLRSLAFTSFDEVRNRAIYELTGKIESGVITDTDPTLPWIAKTGSARDKVLAKYEAARAAIQYMLDNPDKFEDTEVP